MIIAIYNTNESNSCLSELLKTLNIHQSFTKKFKILFVNRYYPRQTIQQVVPPGCNHKYPLVCAIIYYLLSILIEVLQSLMREEFFKIRIFVQMKTRVLWKNLQQSTEYRISLGSLFHPKKSNPSQSLGLIIVWSTQKSHKITLQKTGSLLRLCPITESSPLC